MKRFWDKVNKTDGCWLWTACTDKDGYGQFRLNGKQTKAHRTAWELTRGPIPEGMLVCHKCDITNCVNPAHLFIGTTYDNAMDRTIKGRGKCASGAGHGNTHLQDNDVVKIRRFYANGDISQQTLGAMFGICRAEVSHIVNGITWAHLPIL